MTDEPTWRLAGSTGKPVECFIHPTSSTLHIVKVLFGAEMLLTESYPDSETALTRANQLRDGLLKTGPWTLAPDPAQTAQTPPADTTPSQCAEVPALAWSPRCPQCASRTPKAQSVGGGCIAYTCPNCSRSWSEVPRKMTKAHLFTHSPAPAKQQ